jgi:hypothetical protein
VDGDGVGESECGFAGHDGDVHGEGDVVDVEVGVGGLGGVQRESRQDVQSGVGQPGVHGECVADVHLDVDGACW